MLDLPSASTAAASQPPLAISINGIVDEVLLEAQLVELDGAPEFQVGGEHEKEDYNVSL